MNNSIFLSTYPATHENYKMQWFLLIAFWLFAILVHPQKQKRYYEIMAGSDTLYVSESIRPSDEPSLVSYNLANPKDLYVTKHRTPIEENKYFQHDLQLKTDSLSFANYQSIKQKVMEKMGKRRIRKLLNQAPDNISFMIFVTLSASNNVVRNVALASSDACVLRLLRPKQIHKLLLEISSMYEWPSLKEIGFLQDDMTIIALWANRKDMVVFVDL